MLIKNVELNGEVVDVRLAEGRIAEIGRLQGAADFDGQGGALLPGLHDHHIHLNATAAAMNSVRCGPPEVTNEAELIEALDRPGGGWLRGVGYHDSVAGEIDRNWLDRHGPDRPVRIQHRSGRLWVMNSLAIEKLTLNGSKIAENEQKSGRLLDMDDAIRAGQDFPDLGPLVQKLLSYGITGVTEVTPSNGLAERAHYFRAAKPLKIQVMGKIELPDGHLKLHYHDHDLPPLERLAGEIKAAHDKGRNVAAHCVTRAELMLTLAGIEEAGFLAGDRIEHAAIADRAAIDWMKQIGVIVVTQPNFIAERVEAYRAEIPEAEQKNLWRLKSFEDLPCAAGSDAPFGDPSPWAAMAAAVARPRGFDVEAISPEAALALYTKPAKDAGQSPRKIAVGAVADLCLLAQPWSKAMKSFKDVTVNATWIDGALVYDRIN